MRINSATIIFVSFVVSSIDGMEYIESGTGVNQQVAIVDRSGTLPLANHHDTCIMVSVEQRGGVRGGCPLYIIMPFDIPRYYTIRYYMAMHDVVIMLLTSAV
jgi:hypothetical protein